jgi:hypothetical protein
MPLHIHQLSVGVNNSHPRHVPLYLMVAKFSPTRFGRRKVFFPVSHVPSPTCNVLEEYELLPGGASCGEGDMMVVDDSAGLRLTVEECSISGGKPPAAPRNTPSDEDFSTALQDLSQVDDSGRGRSVWKQSRCVGSLLTICGLTYERGSVFCLIIEKGGNGCKY